MVLAREFPRVLVVVVSCRRRVVHARTSFIPFLDYSFGEEGQFAGCLIELGADDVTASPLHFLAFAERNFAFD